MKLLEVLYQLTKSLVLTVNCLSANIQRFWALGTTTLASASEILRGAGHCGVSVSLDWKE